MKKSIGLFVAAAAFGSLIAGCSATHADAPDPSSDNSHAGTRQAVIQEPDGFRNVTVSCFGKTAIYVTSRGQTSDAVTSGIAVVPNDPYCA